MQAADDPVTLATEHLVHTLRQDRLRAELLERIATESIGEAVAALLHEPYAGLFVPELASIHHGPPLSTRDWNAAIRRDPRTLRLMSLVRHASESERSELVAALREATVWLTDAFQEPDFDPGGAMGVPLLLAEAAPDLETLAALAGLMDATQSAYRASLPDALQHATQQGDLTIRGPLSAPIFESIDITLEHMDKANSVSRLETAVLDALDEYRWAKEEINRAVGEWLEQWAQASASTPETLAALLSMGAGWMDTYHLYEAHVQPRTSSPESGSGVNVARDFRAFQREVVERILGGSREPGP